MVNMTARADKWRWFILYHVKKSTIDHSIYKVLIDLCPLHWSFWFFVLSVADFKFQISVCEIESNESSCQVGLEWRIYGNKFVNFNWRRKPNVLFLSLDPFELSCLKLNSKQKESNEEYFHLKRFLITESKKGK